MDTAIALFGHYDVDRELNAHLINEVPPGTDAQLENKTPIITDITTHAKSLQDEITSATNIPYPISSPAPDQEGNALFITGNKCFKTALAVTFWRIERTSKTRKDVNSATDELMEYMKTFWNKTNGVCMHRKSDSFKYYEIGVTKAREVVEKHIKARYLSDRWLENAPDNNVTDPDSKVDAAEGNAK